MIELNEKSFDAARRAYHKTQIRVDGYETLRAAISAYLAALATDATELPRFHKENARIRSETIEECAKVAENWRRKKLGRDMSKANFDPCGRWEGGEIYEEGKPNQLIASRIRALPIDKEPKK